MEIIISNSGSKPIYEQIADQLKDAMLAGELCAGDQLPSIRALANDLRVSVITTKRVYQDLETQGFIHTVQGKGSFVSQGSQGLLQERRLMQIEDDLRSALAHAATANVDVASLHDMLDALVEEE